MRKELESLIFLGRLEKEINIFGKKWIITTISAKDQLEVARKYAAQDNEVVATNILRITILSYALKNIDGIEMKDPEETAEFLGQMQSSVIMSLFQGYEELLKEQEDAMGDKEELKN